MNARPAIDYLVIGGGFYGCSLALFLRSVSRRVVLVEAAGELLTRASRVNQARVHTGFHYPRSAMTAVKSMVLHRRFAADFPDAVDANFQMLYAIARRRSRISAKRFYRMLARRSRRRIRRRRRCSIRRRSKPPSHAPNLPSTTPCCVTTWLGSSTLWRSICGSTPRCRRWKSATMTSSFAFPPAAS